MDRLEKKQNGFIRGTQWHRFVSYTVDFYRKLVRLGRIKKAF